MPADDLQHAAQLHRRWRGLGPVLFAIFYSLFFAAHLKLERSDLYLKNNAALPGNTASFFNDLVLPRDSAGAGGTGKGSAFLLLHHGPARLLVAAWTPFAGESAARKHAVATLTAGAGAMTVVLLYLALMHSGVERLRAAVIAGFLGVSPVLTLIAVLPQPQVFSALGLTAVLASIARGRSGRWWEFPLAAVYALSCSPWNAVPMGLMGLVSAARIFRGGSPGTRTLLSMLGGVLMLALLVVGAMKLQEWVYPRTAIGLPALMESWQQTLTQVGMQSGKTHWLAVMGDALLDHVVRPKGGAMILLVMLGWVFIVILGIVRLPAAIQYSPVPVIAAMLAGAWCVWFYGTAPTVMERFLASSLATPFVIFLVGVGVEQHVRRWPRLRWPVTCVLAGFLVVQMLYHGPVLEVAR